MREFYYVAGSSAPMLDTTITFHESLRFTVTPGETTMPIVRLDHVQVAAPRIPEAEDRARDFYGGVLGLREIEKPDALKAKGGVWFSTGGGDLHVGLEESFVPAGKAHPALLVRGLVDMRAALEAAGVKISEAEGIPGARRFYVHDPFGNRLELIERD
jgi:catechol 2,3-dioxygenase-like lactoylglutathione lyase family enzyme